MDWKQIWWPMPLENRPVISWLGISHHAPARGDRYQIMGRWCAHIYRYHGELKIDGQAFPIRPGYASICPPSARLEFAYDGPAVHVVAHFSLNESDPIRATKTPIPAMQDLGDDFPRLNAEFESSVRHSRTNPTRAQVKLWEILWQFSERGVAPATLGSAAVNPAVQHVLGLIELRLAQPLKVDDLASEVGLSRNHLFRLFRIATGTTVMSYVRKRRIEKARQLLIHSTRPVKSIAADVGITDLQLFNKTLRRMLGRSPREIRRSSRGEIEVG